MTLRTDHIAGLIFVAFGLLIFALSGDLPFGTLASPGAGMLPTAIGTGVADPSFRSPMAIAVIGG